MLQRQLALYRASVAGKYASSKSCSDNAKKGESSKVVSTPTRGRVKGKTNKNKVSIAAQSEGEATKGKVITQSQAKATFVTSPQPALWGDIESQNATANTVAAGLLKFLKSQNASPHMMKKYMDVIQRVAQVADAKVELDDQVGSPEVPRHVMLPLETRDVEKVLNSKDKDVTRPVEQVMETTAELEDEVGAPKVSKHDVLPLEMVYAEIASRSNEKYKIRQVEQVTEANVKLEDGIGAPEVSKREMLPVDAEVTSITKEASEPVCTESNSEEEVMEETAMSTSRNSDEILQDKLSTFPFEGTLIADVEGSNCADHFDIEVKSGKGSGNLRCYKVHGKSATWSLPAVTDILSLTQDKKRQKLLYGWELREIKKHGKTKHKAIVSSTLNAGSLFHKNVEDILTSIAIEEGNFKLFERPKKSPDTETSVLSSSIDQQSAPKSTATTFENSMLKKMVPASSHATTFTPIKHESPVSSEDNSPVPALSIQFENVFPSSSSINSGSKSSISVKLENLLPVDSSRPSILSIKLEKKISSGTAISVTPSDSATSTTASSNTATSMTASSNTGTSATASSNTATSATASSNAVTSMTTFSSTATSTNTSSNSSTEKPTVSSHSDSAQLPTSPLHTEYGVHPDCHLDTSSIEDFIPEYPEYPDGMLPNVEDEGGTVPKDGGPRSVEWTDAEKAEMKEVPELLMQSVQHVLADISDVKALETRVAHIGLGYGGTFDCVARYKGKLYLIDWKTSTRKKTTIRECYDYPLQLVAYAGAVNHTVHLFNFKIEQVLIVIAYKDGSPADVHEVDNATCKRLWPKWMRRLQQYHTMFSEDLTGVVG